MENNKLKISPALSVLPTIDYRTLNAFQGDLKELKEAEYRKLKLNLFGDGVIPQNEFFVPLMVWIEPKSKKPYILDGHQRVNVIKSCNGEPYELPYLQIDAKNKVEAKKKLALVNSQYGRITRDGWDSFMHDVDVDWVRGMTTLEAFTLPPLDLDIPDIDNALYSGGQMLGGESGEAREIDSDDFEDEDELSSKYTTKVTAPTYEPKNDKPDVSELYKMTTANRLLSEIKESEGISQADKDFLILAAQRHIVFDYEKIADYYAHSTKQMQELMERSALVIIDFNQAIELGYIKLKNDIQAITQADENKKTDNE